MAQVSGGSFQKGQAGLKFPSPGQRELTGLAKGQRELGDRQLPGRSPGLLREVTEALGASLLSR